MYFVLIVFLLLAAWHPLRGMNNPYKLINHSRYSEQSPSSNNTGDEYEDDSDTVKDSSFTRLKYENMERKTSFMQAYMQGSIRCNDDSLLLFYYHYEDDSKGYSLELEDGYKMLHECKKATAKKHDILKDKTLEDITKYSYLPIQKSHELLAQRFIRLSAQGKLRLQYMRFHAFLTGLDLANREENEQRQIMHHRAALENALASHNIPCITNSLKTLEELDGFEDFSLPKFIQKVAKGLKEIE